MSTLVGSPHSKIALLVFLATVMPGCSAASIQCREWRSQGLMYSTIDSCAQCYEQFGKPERDVVAGCAVGLDAAKLINQSQGTGL